MSVNSSSPTNNSFTLYECLEIREISFIAIAFTITKVFLIFPLCVLVLYLGHQRWRQHRSDKTSLSDYFTFQVVTMELVSELGWGLLFCGSYAHITQMTVVGLNVFVIIFPGQTLFHVLTCVERYMAVVHPITYRGLKQSGEVRIRNICTGCIWFLCVGWCTLTALFFPVLSILFFSIFVFSLIVVTFCSISVLCVLIRPGPGDVGKDRERVDQLKQKAFYTITIIMAGLWLLFIGILVCVGLTAAPLLTYRAYCVAGISTVWFNLPGSLVLLLLFLHRAGKLPFCSSSPK